MLLSWMNTRCMISELPSPALVRSNFSSVTIFSFSFPNSTILLSPTFNVNPYDSNGKVNCSLTNCFPQTVESYPNPTAYANEVRWSLVGYNDVKIIIFTLANTQLVFLWRHQICQSIFFLPFQSIFSWIVPKCWHQCLRLY